MTHYLVKFQRLTERARLPVYSTEGAAGMDFFVCADSPVVLYPGETYLFRTGLACDLPKHHALLLFPRSGLGIKHQITLSNSVGVIDHDYKGEICIALQNNSKCDYTVQPGDRVAQGIVFQIPDVSIVEVGEISESARGTGGFGSTGR